MRSVDRNATNLLRGIIGFMPGGEMIFQALQSNGIIERVGTWAQQQLNTLSIAGSSLKHALDDFLHSLSWSDVLHLDDVWERAKRIFTDPINRIKNFVVGLVTDILKFIRDAILRPVAALANGTRGYDLVKGIMGMDPITGDAYERTPENMIGGFMKLIGQEEKWNHLRESNAVGRAWVWFQQQVRILLAFVREIPQLFTTAWERLGIADLLNIPGAFSKIANIFGGFIERFVTWAGEAALQIIKFIFEVLAPGAMDVLNRAMQVFGIIIRDPIRFVGNLVRAGVQGFRQFSTNILTHLRNGLVGWLTGSLTGAGLQLPEVWNLRGILSLVLQILGLTWQNIRTKILRHIPEPVLRTLETTFDIVVTLVREGPMAAWNKILEQLGNLQEMVFGQIREWIQSTIVGQAIIKIASMLNPAGAIIQAIMAIYNTVLFFKERAEQIRQVMEAFFNSIANIAAGNVSGAATFVENAMARTVPVIISFLARLIGLGGISERIRSIIDRIRQPIDRALDKLVEWIVVQARRLGNAVVSGARRVGQRILNWLRIRKSFRTSDGESHVIYFQQQGTQVNFIRASNNPENVKDYLTRLDIKSTDPRFSKYRQAKDLAAEIILITRTPDSGQEATNSRQESQIIEKVNALSILLIDMVGGTAPSIPQNAVPEYDQDNSSKVSKLSSSTARGGGAASGSTPAMDYVSDIRPMWVRMHLISAAIGGSGDKKNWVPAPSSINTGGAILYSFERSLENLVRTAEVPRSVARYRPERTGRHPSVVWVDVTIREKHIINGLKFPKRIEFKYGLYFPNNQNNDWEKINEPISSQDISIPAPLKP